MPDAMVEIWQADAEGRYAHPADGRPLASNSFRGFGRCADRQGRRLCLRHRQAGRRAWTGRQAAGAAHQRRVFSRGMLKRLFTRIYFAGEPANASRSDPGPGAARAARHADGQTRPRQARLWRFDIHLQGANETVFFDA